MMLSMQSSTVFVKWGYIHVHVHIWYMQCFTCVLYLHLSSYGLTPEHPFPRAIDDYAKAAGYLLLLYTTLVYDYGILIQQISK